MATNNAINQKGINPIFSVTSNADQLNFSGAGTTYYVQFPDSLLNTTGAFNTGTGKFTAAFNGLYHFDVSLYVANMTSAATLITGYLFKNDLTTGGYPFVNDSLNFAGANQRIINAAFNVILSTGNTVKLGIAVYGMAGDTADLLGGTTITQVTPLFSGYLITAL